MRWINRLIKLFYTATMIAMVVGCLESYQPPLAEDVSYLVVDGFVNASKGFTTVKLSRTVGLSIGKSIPDELGATVLIESDRGDVFTLKEGTNGNYSSDHVITQGNKYRLRIITNEGKKYSSGFIVLKSSPVLDNVVWKAQPEGVTVYVNAHDETNQTHYYKWTFTETWRYSATELSHFKMEGGDPVPRKADEYVLNCWKTAQENQILIASTLRLDSDVISDFPIAILPAGTQKLSHSYSILVEQRALDEDEYNYWRLLEKTTENLGGLFDPLPAQVTGNIFNEDDPTEPVMGYFSGGNVDEKRMFIVLAELPDYLKFYTPLVKGCEITIISPQNIANTLGNKVILDQAAGGYFVTTAECADCRAQGGVITEPDFWPR
jgi:hypothetical protein